MASDIKMGQKTVAATAAAISTTQEMTWINVRSISSNAEMAIGDSGVTLANGYVILPGETHRLGAIDLAQLYVIGTAGNKLFWIGTHTAA